MHRSQRKDAEDLHSSVNAHANRKEPSYVHERGEDIIVLLISCATLLSRGMHACLTQGQNISGTRPKE